MQEWKKPDDNLGGPLLQLKKLSPVSIAKAEKALLPASLVVLEGFIPHHAADNPDR